jgi:gliding motility-associated-like protein
VTDWGCKAVDSINIYVDPATIFAVPNAFSPGSTGPNNILRILRKGAAVLNYFRIYNRWGNLVFEATNIDAGWDGTYKGKPQAMDVFVYDIQAVTLDGVLFNKKGNVTLIR